MIQQLKQESDDLLAHIPKVVGQARDRAEAKAEQIEARRQIPAAQLDKATRAKEQAKAVGETEVARLETLDPIVDSRP